jgi:hypothetical protein
MSKTIIKWPKHLACQVCDLQDKNVKRELYEYFPNNSDFLDMIYDYPVDATGWIIFRLRPDEMGCCGDLMSANYSSSNPISHEEVVNIKNGGINDRYQ